MKKFKMIVPMRPDERLEAEKAGKGTTKVRKGIGLRVLGS